MRTPLAPIGWPNDLSPPLGFTGMSPSSAVRPSSTSFPPSPFLQKPRSSMFDISVQVKQSCTSAKSRSRAFDQHRRLLEALGQVGAADYRRGGPVGRGAAVEEAERPG